MSRWPLSTIAPTSNSLETDTHAHMFSTNAALQQEEYIPSGLWVVSLTCFLITPHCSDPSVAEDYWEVRFSVKCVLASCEDPLRFGYNMKGGGGLGGQQHYAQPFKTNADAFSQQTHNSTLILPRHTLPLRMTQRRAHKERHVDVSPSSYPANSTSGRAKLQQPHQQGDAQAHMIRRSLPRAV